MPIDQPTKQPLTSDQGWNRALHALAYGVPKQLYHAGRMRASIRALIRGRHA